MASRTPRTPKKHAREQRFDLFLESLADGATVSAAARDAGFARRADVYEHRGRDEGFADRWDAIVEETTERMEQEAFRRAHDGWIERQEFEVNEAGEPVPTLTVRKYSDTLLIFLLKARRPATYRENHRVEHVGHDGGPVNVRVDLDEKQRKALSDVLRGRPATRSD